MGAGANGTGSIQASSLEGSNVDISAELVKMVQTQSAYSANARVISTANEMLKTIEQIVQ
jgi:flagellar hook protein FlgE